MSTTPVADSKYLPLMPSVLDNGNASVTTLVVGSSSGSSDPLAELSELTPIYSSPEGEEKGDQVRPLDRVFSPDVPRRQSSLAPCPPFLWRHTALTNVLFMCMQDFAELIPKKVKGARNSVNGDPKWKMVNEVCTRHRPHIAPAPAGPASGRNEA